MKKLELRQMIREELQKFIDENEFPRHISAKNIKVGDVIHKFGKVTSKSKQNHLIIVYSGKNRKIYGERESVTIDN